MSIINKQYIFIFLLSLGVTEISGKDFLFVGIYQTKANEKIACSNYSLITQEFDNKDEAILFKNEFFKKDDFKNKKADLFSPGYIGLIYRYKRHSFADNCNMIAISTIKAATVDEAKSNLHKHAVEYSKYFLSQPEILLTWHGTGYSKVIKRNYDGCEITFIASKKSSAKTVVLAKIKNTRTDTAHIFFLVDKNIPDRYILPSGNSGTYMLGNDVNNFDVAVEFTNNEKSTESKNIELINTVKNIIREHITTKDGLIKSNTISGGVRG